MKKYLLSLLFISILSSAWAQDTDKPATKGATPSPDFPGSLVIEYGLNYLINPVQSMRTDPWKSSTINVFYMYPIQIGNSRFSVNPGIGIGNEKFGFEDPITFYDSLGFTLLYDVLDYPGLGTATEISKTQLIASYVDFPLELRVHSRKDDFDRSWYLAIGGKIGVNFDAKTKIKYIQNGTRKTQKNKHDYNINMFRYGLIARIGYGPFNMWYYYSGSQLFRGNKTPNFDNTNMFSFGISLATF
jgi:Outer membrane protein beta-barrel domain